MNVKLTDELERLAKEKPRAAIAEGIAQTDRGQLIDGERVMDEIRRIAASDAKPPPVTTQCRWG